MQVNPGAEPPSYPPMEAFVGDNVTLTLQARPGGVVRFTASGPNADGMLTELLMQKLPRISRKPVPFYKSAAFHVFEPEALDVDMTLNSGAYAFAYRFVQRSTGQASLMLLLGVVVVE